VFASRGGDPSCPRDKSDAAQRNCAHANRPDAMAANRGRDNGARRDEAVRAHRRPNSRTTVLYLDISPYRSQSNPPPSGRQQSPYRHKRGVATKIGPEAPTPCLAQHADDCKREEGQCRSPTNLRPILNSRWLRAGLSPHRIADLADGPGGKGAGSLIKAQRSECSGRHIAVGYYARQRERRHTLIPLVRSGSAPPIASAPMTNSMPLANYNRRSPRTDGSASLARC